MLLAEDQTYQLAGTVPTRSATPQRLPALLVNPALEEVLLHFDGHHWHHTAGHGFASLGLHPPNQRVDPTGPLPRATAYVLGGQVAVQLADSAWNAPLLPAIANAIAREGGLLLILTSTVNPGEPALTAAVVRRLLSSPRDVVLGWVALPQVLAAHGGHSGSRGRRS